MTVIARPLVLSTAPAVLNVVKFTGPVTDDHQQVHALPSLGE